jgi:7-alpha-hydroxysteroid dehydrogenase
VRGDFFELTAQDFEQVMETNLKSTFVLSQGAARKMIQLAKERDERCKGSIVNISSVAATRTLPQLLPYSVSCAALDQLTRSMAVALAPKGIRVNGVALGGVMTRSIRDALKELDDFRAQMTAVTPLGRIGEPAEAAELALYLASDAASFVTGQVVTMDGGRSLLDPLATPAV